MKVLLVEPYMTGSHAAWAQGYQKYSSCQIKILGLKGQYWKWRMHGGAVELAHQYKKFSWKPDLLLASDMLDLSTFLALTRPDTADIPSVMYFHENQLSYPWSPDDRDVAGKRDHHYGFINYVSALSADRVFFNSKYHMDSFLGALPRFLKNFPDYRGLQSIEQIAAKSCVLYLGLDLQALDSHQSTKGKNRIPLILWNHRWEYDKNPEDFFKALSILDLEGCAFQVALLGENFQQMPDIFHSARERLGDKIVQFGYIDSFESYAGWLWQADILPVTSNHDFFGASVIEAIYCGGCPVLPDRLAYRELLDESGQSDNFYTDFNEFIEKLKQMLCQYPDLDCMSLQSRTRKYDWSEMAPQYDKVLQLIVENRP